MIAKYYNGTMGFCDTTIPILEDLEELKCPNVEVCHVADQIRVANSRCPSYADVFDWLMYQGFCIHIEPCSTYASPNRNAWWWVLTTYNTEDAYVKKEYTDTDMYCNWDECAWAAIKKAVGILKNQEE